jgi:hypothetical protein
MMRGFAGAMATVYEDVIGATGDRGPKGAAVVSVGGAKLLGVVIAASEAAGAGRAVRDGHEGF